MRPARTQGGPTSAGTSRRVRSRHSGSHAACRAGPPSGPRSPTPCAHPRCGRRGTLVAGAEVEDPALAPVEHAPGAEHLATRERAHEHELVGLRDVEELAVHLLRVDDERARDTFGDGVAGLDGPDQLALGARRANLSEQVVPISLMKIFEKWAECRGSSPMPLQHVLVHAVDDLVVDPVVRHVTPPGEDVGVGEDLFGEPVLRVVESDRAHLDSIAELRADAGGDRAVHAVRIERSDLGIPLLVLGLPPDGHADRTGGACGAVGHGAGAPFVKMRVRAQNSSPDACGRLHPAPVRAAPAATVDMRTQAAAPAGPVRSRATGVARAPGYRRTRRRSGRRTCWGRASPWVPATSAGRPEPRPQQVHDTIEDVLGVAHPQVSRARHRDDVGLTDGGEPFAGGLGTQIVVELRDESGDRPAVRVPPGEVVGGRVPQRRRQEDGALDAWLEAVLQHEVGTERPPEQPDVGQIGELRCLHGGRHVESFAHRVVEGALAGALRAARPRVLNRRTAMSASAGRRAAALRKTWLSIMPPWVGSGWTQTRVASGSPAIGRASSATRSSRSAVCNVRAARRAGSTEFARTGRSTPADSPEPVTTAASAAPGRPSTWSASAGAGRARCRHGWRRTPAGSVRAARPPRGASRA